MLKRLLPLFSGLLISSGLMAQCMLVPVSLKDKNQESELVVDARVRNSFVSWDANHRNILTVFELQVDRVLKGNAPQSLYVATLGGTIGNMMQQVTNELELHTGERGIFWLENGRYRSAVNPALVIYRPYASVQGMIHIAKDGSSQTPFMHWDNEASMFSELQQAGGLLPFSPKLEIQGVEKTGGVPVVNSFSPDTISAGTRSVLTIKGTDFGTTMGTVYFKDANDGGASYLGGINSDILTWTDTLIRVRVFSRAGTGTFQVSNSAGNGVSAKALTISYSHLNVSYDNKFFLTRHIAKNAGSGGYVWRMNDGNFNDRDSAKKSFLRAFQNWRCNTFINWTIGDSTSADIMGADGINVITFDNNDPLPNGTLGVCSSFWQGCFTSSDTSWYVNELDIIFDQGVNWSFGPGAPGGSQFDFESVALHELGHGHQAGHVIKSTEVMHYSIGPGQSKNTLSTNDITGMQAVMNRNLSGGVCGNPKMTALNGTNCGLLSVANFTADKKAVCSGNTVTFTDSSYGLSGTYDWSFGTGASPSTATGAGPHTVTYNTPGTATVSLTVTSSLGADTRTKPNFITINPPKPADPTVIYGDTLVCTANGHKFKVNSVPNASSYQWTVSSGGTVVSTSDTTATLNLPLKSTAYTISVRAVNSCGNSATKSMQVRSSAKLLASFMGTVSVDTIKITNTAAVFDSIVYRVGAQYFRGNPNQNLIAPNGQYEVVQYLYSPCGVDSTSRTFIVAVGIMEQHAENIRLQPNPAKDQLAVYIPVLPGSRTLQVRWTDMQGRIISESNMEYKDVLLLERGNMANGNYILEINGGSNLLLKSQVVFY